MLESQSLILQADKRQIRSSSILRERVRMVFRSILFVPSPPPLRACPYLIMLCFCLYFIPVK